MWPIYYILVVHLTVLLEHCNNSHDVISRSNELIWYSLLQWLCMVNHLPFRVMLHRSLGLKKSLYKHACILDNILSPYTYIRGYHDGS